MIIVVIMITLIIIIIIISIIIHYYSVLSYLAKFMSSIKNASLYADLPSFPSLSLITGDPLRPDLVLVLNNNWYILSTLLCV